MLIMYLVIVIPLALAIGAIGIGRKIGFLPAFLWSALASPIVGLAITLLSDKKDTQVYDFTYYYTLGKEAEEAGNITEAIDYYFDSLTHLEKGYKNLSKKSEEGRQRHIKKVSEKIDVLKNIKRQAKTTSI